MKKSIYSKPVADSVVLSGEGLFCDSGAGTEDFGKTPGIGNDIFDSIKPF